MSMRVFECNVCGEVLSGANDDELLRRLAEHLQSVHEQPTVDEPRAREMLSREAYTAADS